MINRRSSSHHLTTYQKARLQMVAYRSVQNRVSEILLRHQLNISQWIILGWLCDNPAGMRVTALARVLEVETPLITSLVGPLQKRELVHVAADSDDRRAKLLTLTPAGETLVREVNEVLEEHLAKLEQGFKKNELEAYYSILERFVDNEERTANK